MADLSAMQELDARDAVKPPASVRFQTAAIVTASHVLLGTWIPSTVRMCRKARQWALDNYDPSVLDHAKVNFRAMYNTNPERDIYLSDDVDEMRFDATENAIQKNRSKCKEYRERLGAIYNCLENKEHLVKILDAQQRAVATSSSSDSNERAKRIAQKNVSRVRSELKALSDRARELEGKQRNLEKKNRTRLNDMMAMAGLSGGGAR